MGVLLDTRLLDEHLSLLRLDDFVDDPGRKGYAEGSDGFENHFVVVQYGDTIPIYLRSSLVRLSVDRSSMDSMCKTVSSHISSVQVAVLSTADHAWHRGRP